MMKYMSCHVTINQIEFSKKNLHEPDLALSHVKCPEVLKDKLNMSLHSTQSS